MLYREYLKKLSGCPFCETKYYGKQLIAENETSALIISISPYQKHHLLIIPKRHIERIIDITEKESRDIIELQNLAIKILYSLNYKDINILVREGENIGKSVRHLHYHIVPNSVICAIEILDRERTITPANEIKEIIANIKILLENF